ncbi:MAG: DEAD/DEAH box helicase, partial [Collinsella aerofaciens]|nr:DEAD/DEAH box helicase [Collinsella aerofaciens]
EIAPATSTADTVDQFVFPVSIEAKNNLLPEFLKKEGPERTIVFMRTKHRADSCCRRLERKGIKAAAIHGNRSQAQRERALSAFRDGTVDVLVATDVLARGIDISDVRYVVNFDVPAEPTDYIHRIGRTGRAGELGWAITFVTEQDVDEFYEIEKLMDKTADIYEAGDLYVGPNPPAVDPERDPAAFKVKKKTKRGKSKSKKKLEQARRDGKRNGDDYGDVAGRSNRGRGDGERPSRPKRGGKTRVREGVQARVDEAVESVAREVAAEERGGAAAVEQAPRGNRAERRAKQFQGEAHRRRREDEDRGGRRRVEREDEGRGSRGSKCGAGDRRRSGRNDEHGGRDERRGGESHGAKRFDERGGRGGERHEGGRGNGGRSNESRDRRDPRASRDRRDDWRNYDDTREERRGGYHGGRGGNQAGSRGGRAGGRDNRGSYGNSRGGKRGGSSRRPGDGGGKRK